MTNAMKFEELPIEVQERIKKILKAYDDVDVWYEYGEYNFNNTIKKVYGDDHRYVGTYKATDVFTLEERIINYCDAFHSFPCFYDGERDYSIMKDYKAKYKMVDGVVVLA